MCPDGDSLEGELWFCLGGLHTDMGKKKNYIYFVVIFQQLEVCVCVNLPDILVETSLLKSDPTRGFLNIWNISQVCPGQGYMKMHMK